MVIKAGFTVLCTLKVCNNGNTVCNKQGVWRLEELTLMETWWTEAVNLFVTLSQGTEPIGKVKVTQSTGDH